MTATAQSRPREGIPDELVVGRGDPVYMAHAYLTKVPVPAIIPFIEAFSRPGDVVVDPFAGSGMTGVAAVATGRHSRMSDVSVLGRHIGSNYLNLVDRDLLAKLASECVEGARLKLGPLYRVACTNCGKDANLVKEVWSVVIQCRGCRRPVNYYEALKTADWSKPDMVCPHCAVPVDARCARVGEAPVLDYVDCSCEKTQVEQVPASAPSVNLDAIDYPKVEIGSDRQMYQASALGKHGLTSVASFYSARNLATLGALRAEIAAVTSDDLREKLLFAFTACLTRASKRYQWSKKRPLNAANANYYVAPVFYEWNVFDLFLRKVEAASRADDWIRAEIASRNLDVDAIEAEYVLSSADALPYEDASAAYVFMDPPFGSNLFYADMALFQEAWLGEFTASETEAVVDRVGSRTATRYEALLTGALRECRRVVEPGGHVSMVFGNSSGAMWALIQRAIASARLRIEPEHLVVLNKGQRSVKGLASGFEHVATLDLIVTMTACDDATAVLHKPAAAELEGVTRALVDGEPQTPSHLYLSLLRHCFASGWDASGLDLRTVTKTLIDDGWQVDSKSGTMRRADGGSPAAIGDERS